jgi:tetratricopeptide (TPR) repeat protein
MNRQGGDIMKISGKLLLILLLALSVFVNSVTCEAQAPAQASEAAAADAQAAQERWVAVVTSAQGGVYIQRPGQTQWGPLKVADKCYPGDSIRVEENSRAALVFKNDSTLRIDQNTTLTFQPMEEQTILMRIFNGAATFFSRIPRSLKIFTPHMNGTVKGTEFVIRVDGDQTQINLFDGQILAENEKGELLISKGQSVIAKTGQAPVAQAVVRPRHAVQWALYYPAIMDFRPEDFPGGAEWQGKVRQSIEAWRKGDLSGAFGALKGIDDAGIQDTRYLSYRATLALAVGQAQEASAWLDRILKADPKNANAYALQSIIATAQNNKTAATDLATRAVSLDPQSPATRIALSYAQQAVFDINGATASVQEAVRVSPNDAYARSRLAELWLMQGWLNRALEEAQRAVSIKPELARTQTVLGFAYLMQVNIAESRAAFEKAIQIDSADPLPRLGLGLAIIRRGGLEEGRREIEIAASLDVNNSLIRSYLGKAYYEEKRENLSATQLGIAKELDPKDPTPWFYDAILKQSVNRPVEAMQDIQKSIELNDNRAVFRSKLLLDQDLAARSASLGQIFNNLGFQQIALVEGWKSVNTDPANFSAHRFLAETYSALPRHDVARVSELLQSQLLQPININPVPPLLAEGKLRMFEGSGPTGLSFNEFNPLFNRNRVALQASGALGDKNTAGDEVTVSGVYDKFSMSLGQFYFKSDGFRTNNDQNRELYNAFAQWMVTPQTSVQAELRYSNFNYGDLALRFDPNQFSYAKDNRSVDWQKTARLGIRHAFSPDSDLIASFIYSYAHYFANLFLGVISDEMKDEALQFEVQHLYRADRFRLITGAGYANVNRDEYVEVPIDSSANMYQQVFQHFNGYAYTLTTFPQSVTWTLGVSADFYRDPIIDKNQLNPKLGVTWTPWDSTTFRAAAFRTLKRTLTTQQTIEPTQVAGFNQFFDDANGTDATLYGVAVDQKITNNLFTGLELSKRDLSQPYSDPIIGNITFAWHEELARAYLYWAPYPWFAASAEYEYLRQDRDPPYTGEENFTKILTQRFPLALNIFHPSGLSAMFKGTYVMHESDNFDDLSMGIIPGSDYFWVFDAALSYRLPKRYGIISIEAKNLFNQSFHFVDTDKYIPRIYPDRFIIGRITLSF